MVVADAYLTGLKLLAGRELSEAQIRTRLARRKFEPDEIDAAVSRLQSEGALDDRRAAFACARTEAYIKRHGQLRALRRLQVLGIDRRLARVAVAEVFADLNEDDQIAQAIDRRLRRGASLSEQAVAARIHRYLLSQGFDAGRVHAALQARIKQAVDSGR
jgi:regulatory protein